MMTDGIAYSSAHQHNVQHLLKRDIILQITTKSQDHCPLKHICYPLASLTIAAAFVVREHEARLAGALEAAGGVGAGAILADVGLHLTLIDIWEGSINEWIGGEDKRRICECVY